MGSDFCSRTTCLKVKQRRAHGSDGENLKEAGEQKRRQAAAIVFQVVCGMRRARGSLIEEIGGKVFTMKRKTTSANGMARTLCFSNSVPLMKITGERIYKRLDKEFCPSEDLSRRVAA